MSGLTCEVKKLVAATRCSSARRNDITSGRKDSGVVPISC